MFSAALEYYVKNNKNVNIEKINNLYFGPGYTDDYIENVLKNSKHYEYKKYEDINSKIADMLSDGKIIAGYMEMEFGASLLK